MGIGIVAAMAQDCPTDSGLVGLEAGGLFPRCTTWIGFRRDAVLKKYMYHFIELFAPHLDEHRVRRALETANQSEVEALLAGIPLPLKGRCAEEVSAAE
jgi:LysR family cys regulon transcriptional activator